MGKRRLPWRLLTAWVRELQPEFGQEMNRVLTNIIFLLHVPFFLLLRSPMAVHLPDIYWVFILYVYTS